MLTESQIEAIIHQAAVRKRWAVVAVIAGLAIYLGVPWFVWSYLALAVSWVPISATLVAGTVGTITFVNGLAMYLDSRNVKEEIAFLQSLSAAMEKDIAEQLKKKAAGGER